MKLSSLQIQDDASEEISKSMEPPSEEYARPLVRQEAWDASEGILKAFGAIQGEKSKEKACLGHKESIFGVTFSDCGTFCATASQDSTICVWDVATNKLLNKLTAHSSKYECLRVAWASSSWAKNTLDRTSGNKKHLIASAGADGQVILWACEDPRIKNGKGGWEQFATIEHAELLKKNSGSEESKPLDVIQENEDEEEKQPEEPDKPQVYALEFIDHWQAFNNADTDSSRNSFLMTSSDDYIHFWEFEVVPASADISLEQGTIELVNKIVPKEVMSLHFGSLEHYGFGVSVCNITGSGLAIAPQSSSPEGTGFGGDRNPSNLNFVFDAAYCAANGLLGVALSDGSLRLVNGRGVCVSILNLPGCQSHLTSFCWDDSGTKLATCVATGHLITWQLEHIDDLQGNGQLVATCVGIMEGGHQVGRPLYGSRYLGDSLLASWSVDGSICLWDSWSQGNINSPMAILRQDDSYPVYAVEVSSGNCIAVGGGSEGGFIGVPLYLYPLDKNVSASTSAPAKSTTESKKEEDVKPAAVKEKDMSPSRKEENKAKEDSKIAAGTEDKSSSQSQTNENSSNNVNAPTAEKGDDLKATGPSPDKAALKQDQV